ncbi:MAG: TetR/AcrR family transcriptional regulator [Thermomicrobiales bacterium]
MRKANQEHPRDQTSQSSARSAPAQARSDARRNRARLLEAARTEFQTHGTALQIEEVAAKAGVGVGTIYRNFANKDLLIEAVILQEMEKGRQRFAEIDPSLPPWEAFVAAVRILALNVLESRSAAPTIYALGASGAIRSEIERFYEIFIVHVRRAQEAGDLRNDLSVYDIAELVVRTVSPGLEPISWKPLSADLTERLTTVMLDGLHASGRSGAEIVAR